MTLTEAILGIQCLEAGKTQLGKKILHKLCTSRCVPGVALIGFYNRSIAYLAETEGVERQTWANLARIALDEIIRRIDMSWDVEP